MPTWASALLAYLALPGCAQPPAPTVGGAPDGVPSASAPLALDHAGKVLWVVNPDADSVTAVDTATLTARAPVAVGAEPWAVATTPGGGVVVLNRASGSLTVLLGGTRRDVRVGPEPGGLALSPTGRYALVTLSAEGALVAVDLERMRVVAGVRLGPFPWAVAVTDDGDPDDLGETVVVTHRLARLRAGGAEATNDGKEAWVTTLALDDLLDAAGEAFDPDTPGSWPPLGSAAELAIEPYAFGYANGLEAVALWRGSAYVPHLLNAPEPPRDFESTISGALTALPLAAAGGGGPLDGKALRLHVNDEAFSSPTNHPTAVAPVPGSDLVLVTLGGSDAVMGVDLSGDEPMLAGFWPAGSNPRGVVVAADGGTAYVLNYLSRDVSVIGLTDRTVRREVARVRVAPETLDAETLRGKVLFHHAASARLSQLGWIACASCHLGGGVDGTTWLTPDGPRQTQPLWSLDGTAPFHASATRDEVQDFEHDIEGLMAGSGLAPGAARRELGQPNGGLSPDLDALARYVLTGVRVPRAPRIDPGAAARGRDLFASLGCATCHGGEAWTASGLPGPVGTLAPAGEVEVLAALRDVGTYDPERDVLGANGFDVPRLLGLAASPPYLHDGSAAALEDVLGSLAHVGAELTAPQAEELVEFLRSIDARTPTY